MDDPGVNRREYTGLIGESPEAQRYVESITAKSDQYRRFADERFAEIKAAVLATSGVDRQNEAITPEALEQMADQINRESLWMMLAHNPLFPPPGRVLAARRFYAPQSGLYFIAGIIGVYDSGRLPTFHRVGVDLAALPVAEAYEPGEADRVFEARLMCSPHEFADDTVEKMLREAPAFVSRDADSVRRKSAEPQQILTVIATLWLLVQNPFSKKLLERYGEKAADASLAFLSWVKDKVCTAFADARPDALFVLETPFNGCCVEFVVASTVPAVIVEATQSVHEAANSAVALIGQLKHLGMQKLVYEYDQTAKRWLPLYAATRGAGVITDRPRLIALDQFQGLSMGARRRRP